MLRNVPAAQVAGMRMLLPSAHTNPRPQASHELLEEALWKVPIGQTEQDALLMFGAWLPGLQGNGAVAPAKHMRPGGHAAQLDWPLAGWYVPWLHL
jgi:hypothetical protein